MDLDFSIGKIITGIIATFITALVIYIFRMRQLYILAPKMFSYNTNAEQGKTVTLNIFNRSRFMEEDVQINLPPDPSIQYNLISADYSDVKIENHKISLERVPSKTEVSIILSAKGFIPQGEFIPSITSKAGSGKIVKRRGDIPQNHGDRLIITFLYISLSIIFYYGIISFFDYKRERINIEKKEAIKKYSHFEKIGWVNFDSYALSEAKKSYGIFEYPLSFDSYTIKNDTLTIKFIATNKTATHLEIDVNFERADKPFSLKNIENRKTITLAPMQSSPITIETKEKNLLDEISKNNLVVSSSFRFGNENIRGAYFYPFLNEKFKEDFFRTPSP